MRLGRWRRHRCAFAHACKFVVALVALSLLRSPRAMADVATVAPTTIVLVAPASVVEDAVRRSLTPWSIRVVVVAAQPDDGERAAALALAHGATHVVWVRAGSVVVYERATAMFTHRPAPTGEIDDASAAAVALSVKTALRLPALEPGERPAPTPGTSAGPTPAPAPAASTTWRGGGGARLGAVLPLNGAQAAGVRGWLDAELSVGRVPGLVVGVAVDVGPAATFNKTGFKGTRRDVGAVVSAGWRLAATSALDLTPSIFTGLSWAATHGKLSGDDDVDRSDVIGRVGLAIAATWGHRRVVPVVRFDGEVRVGEATGTHASGGSQVVYFEPSTWMLGVSAGVRVSY